MLWTATARAVSYTHLKTAIDSLDNFIAQAELPLPSSPEGDSYEKLLAWKLNPESSLSYKIDHAPLVNGRLDETLQRCWSGERCV